MLHALARKAPPTAHADVGLNGQPWIGQVVIGPDRLEYLLIRTSRCSLTIRLVGHRASLAPVCLTFQVPAQEAKGAAARMAFYAGLTTVRPRWMKRSRRQLMVRDAFVAYDGLAAGASHREVAEVIVGYKRARDEWSARGGWLKARAQRALAAGQALCGGGHWKYVEQAYRFAA